MNCMAIIFLKPFTGNKKKVKLNKILYIEINDGIY